MGRRVSRILQPTINDACLVFLPAFLLLRTCSKIHEGLNPHYLCESNLEMNTEHRLHDHAEDDKPRYKHYYYKSKMMITSQIFATSEEKGNGKEEV